MNCFPITFNKEEHPSTAPAPKKQEFLVDSLYRWVLVLLFLTFNILSILSVTTKNYKEGGSIFTPVQAMSNKTTQPTHEVMGFAPYWTIKKLGNVDFNTLTTLAYFGIPINADGSFDTEDPGYTTFMSKDAQDIFATTKLHGKRVVATLTIMDGPTIEAFLENPWAQVETITRAKEMMKNYDLDGFNIDIEYVGNPGKSYRDAFSKFVADFRNSIHEVNDDAKVTVSVYASAAKEQKLYDIAAIGQASDAIFMMAYDFATTSAKEAMPTAPLYGHKEKKYWYDVSTAVNDFLKVMPANKLILGVPYYGYSYAVYNPTDKAPVIRSRYSKSYAQTYASSVEDIMVADSDSYRTGWDAEGRVRWKAYKETAYTWRMVYEEDVSSLSEKYEFAKNKNLAGVGIWALGFDNNRTELWDLLRTAFAPSLADRSIGSTQN